MISSETSATAANLGVSLDTRPASYTAELAPADARTTKRPLIKDVRAKTTMGDEAREERNQLARQDASVSTYNRRSPLGRCAHQLHCFSFISNLYIGEWLFTGGRIVVLGVFITKVTLR
ncbi:unnamed protein product [Nippostrongylus brasiliensis]|uniref:Uncharacterized protein n=1 Tax=Nippostrongylus brasiliensis TaxID=27835 RepID=A0A3P7ANL4_NIPBR|nr:unnamed protein product [Nippostrongylus brasiliensis]